MASDQSNMHTLNPALAALGGPLAHRVEKILDYASRVNGERNYSTEKLWRAWTLAGLALVDELGVDPQELVDEVEATRRRVEGSRS